MLTLYERIKSRREQLNMSQEELALKLGYKSRSSINKIEKGENDIPQSKIVAFARALNTTPSFLMGWEDASESKIPDYPNIFPIERKKIPLIGKIACGKPILAEEVFDGFVQCNSNIHADFCLRAEGDSMINARIYDGDIVFIHQQPEVENGEIAAVSIDDSVTLKRVYIEDDCIELRAENPRIKPLRYKISDFNQFRILGKAIAFQGDII